MGITFNLKKADMGKRVTGTLAIPVIFTVVCLSVCAGGGEMILNSATKFSNFLSYTAIVMLTTFALSINLGSGRFDFSLGSMAALSAIIGAKLSYSALNGGPGSSITMLFFCLAAGAVLGASSGCLYVALRIPPIITSLGVTLIFEGISFVLTNGAYVMGEVQNASMSAFRTSWYAPLFIVLLALAAVYFIFDRTKFGYQYKALREGQKVAVDTGIKEVPNAIACYVISGALMGVVGFLNAVRDTNIKSDVLNFGSIGIMFTAFLPMFIGGFIGRFSNDKLGYLLAAVSMSLLNSTFVAYSSVIDASTRSIVEAVLLVAFLIYLNNEKLVRDIVTCKHLRDRIKRRKNANGATGVSQ